MPVSMVGHSHLATKLYLQNAPASSDVYTAGAYSLQEVTRWFHKRMADWMDFFVKDMGTVGRVVLPVNLDNTHWVRMHAPSRYLMSVLSRTGLLYYRVDDTEQPPTVSLQQ
jgi:hypothetical protein